MCTFIFAPKATQKAFSAEKFNNLPRTTEERCRKWSERYDLTKYFVFFLQTEAKNEFC